VVVNIIGLIVIAVIGVVCLFWWQKTNETKKRERLEEFERNKLSDESVLKAQLEFERRLEENVDLPDGIRGKTAFIYRNLMTKWFSGLIATNRYDEAMCKKLNSDWLEYLYLLEHQQTSNLLSLESSDQSKRASYLQEAWEGRKRYEMIEDGFSAAIGKKATEELRQIREMKYDAFDRSGRNAAPVGYHYFPASIRPYTEKLVPDKDK
jgi:hypothetical protein